jgi:hypothetical protein
MAIEKKLLVKDVVAKIFMSSSGINNSVMMYKQGSRRQG